MAYGLSRDQAELQVLVARVADTDIPPSNVYSLDDALWRRCLAKMEVDFAKPPHGVGRQEPTAVILLFPTRP